MVLKAVDKLIHQAKEQGEKVIYELYRSLVLQKHKESFDKEIVHGEVKMETLSKCADFILTEFSIAVRMNKDLDDATKEDEIRHAHQILPEYKVSLIQFLNANGIKIV